MKSALLLFVLFLCPATTWALQPEKENETESAELVEEEVAENPGGPEDDSYTHPETLSHRAGYIRRNDIRSTANTINQLEEDDRVKEPINRFPRVDAALKGWYDMKRRLNEQSAVKICFDYNSLYQSANKALTDDDSAWIPEGYGMRYDALIRHESPMSVEADEVIDYESTALYILPLAAVTLYGLELCRLSRGAHREDAVSALAQMPDLPRLLGEAYRRAEADSLEQARRFLSATAMTVLASGPLLGLGYKFALTVFMENIRVAGSFIESSEFRHGPVEALERSRLDVVALLGTDESRSMTERAIAAVETGGSRVLRFDAADYDGVHPQFAPFLLLVPLQWFTVHSALLRGITNLDERVFMGHRVLAAGPDATWP